MSRAGIGGAAAAAPAAAAAAPATGVVAEAEQIAGTAEGESSSSKREKGKDDVLTLEERRSGSDRHGGEGALEVSPLMGCTLERSVDDWQFNLLTLDLHCPNLRATRTLRYS